MAKILVIDDVAKIRNLIKRILKSEPSYEIFEAEHSVQALAMIEQDRPDIILLDVMMPDMDGFELCKKIREDLRYNLIYIIMVTAKSDADHKITGLDIGADDYITKPFHPGELHARIRNGLRTIEKQRYSMIDQRTLLYNKVFFDNFLQHEIVRSQRYKFDLTILFLDIDHFKNINDNYGHAAGDIVLAEIGGILKAECRQSDIPVRWGGEEFAVILPETSLTNSQVIAERIRITIADHDFPEVGHITVSIGLAQFSSNVKDLLNQADSALYQAKNNGRNQIAIASPLTNNS